MDLNTKVGRHTFAALCLAISAAAFIAAYWLGVLVGIRNSTELKEFSLAAYAAVNVIAVASYFVKRRRIKL